MSDIKELLRLKKLALDNHRRAISYYEEVDKLLEKNKLEGIQIYKEFKDKLIMTKFSHGTLDAFHSELKKVLN
mgnify:FL=1|tara:strand:- start:5583 stop:5801 length:219 start_codon:yes stop_codon:yes gene_type:complete